MSDLFGFRFKPTEKHIIYDYLRCKVKNEPLPCKDVIIEDRDLYSDVPWNVINEEDPYEIDYSSNKVVKTFYVFTSVSKLGERSLRTVGCHGTWKGETGKLESKGSCYVDGKKEDCHIGFKRLLKFKAAASAKVCDELKSTYGDWNMKEYSLGGVLLEGLDSEECSLAKELVVCRVRQTLSLRTWRDMEARNKRSKLTSTSKRDLPKEDTMKKICDRDEPAINCSNNNNGTKTVDIKEITRYEDVEPIRSAPAVEPAINCSNNNNGTKTEDMKEIIKYEDVEPIRSAPAVEQRRLTLEDIEEIFSYEDVEPIRSAPGVEQQCQGRLGLSYKEMINRLVEEFRASDEWNLIP